MVCSQGRVERWQRARMECQRVREAPRLPVPQAAHLPAARTARGEPRPPEPRGQPAQAARRGRTLEVLAVWREGPEVSPRQELQAREQDPRQELLLGARPARGRQDPPKQELRAAGQEAQDREEPQASQAPREPQASRDRGRQGIARRASQDPQ